MSVIVNKILKESDNYYLKTGQWPKYITLGHNDAMDAQTTKEFHKAEHNRPNGEIMGLTILRIDKPDHFSLNHKPKGVNDE